MLVLGFRARTYPMVPVSTIGVATPCLAKGVKMGKMSRQEINKLMERYIGSSGGYLGDFGSHPELLRFYIDCGLDVLPTDYLGTNKESLPGDSGQR